MAYAPFQLGRVLPGACHTAAANGYKLGAPGRGPLTLPLTRIKA